MGLTESARCWPSTKRGASCCSVTPAVPTRVFSRAVRDLREMTDLWPITTTMNPTSRSRCRADGEAMQSLSGSLSRWKRAKGCSVELSWVVMDPLSRRELMGQEVDLIAAHRAAFGDSPTCQFAGGRLGAE